MTKNTISRPRLKLYIDRGKEFSMHHEKVSWARVNLEYIDLKADDNDGLIFYYWFFHDVTKNKKELGSGQTVKINGEEYFVE